MNGTLARLSMNFKELITVYDRRHRMPGMKPYPRQIVVSILLCLACRAAAEDEPSAPHDPLAELDTVVVLTREARDVDELPESVVVISEEEIQRVSARHPNELLFRSPGTWISRGSGLEHLTAIRSPVLTGPGSCGAFLYLEDGVPIRPAGFCNVNNLIEINTEQAKAIEVVRGPGTAWYGSNALHGMINVLSLSPYDFPRAGASLEVGSNDFVRLMGRYAAIGDSGAVGITGHLDHAGSFRDNEGYDQQKLNVRWDTAWGSSTGATMLAVTNLEQETAGFIFGFESYKDPVLRQENLNPEAFRNADAQRFTSAWDKPLGGDASFTVTPYIRRSRMDFLQHFLPGQPLEENGQDSAGALLSWQQERETRFVGFGADLEFTDGFLKETQAEPITDGSDSLMETRPAGKHYDYQVDAVSAALFGHAEWQVSPSVRLLAGLRFDYIQYDYDNRMLDGNTDDNGNECGFGGCLFNRPADRKDDFTNLIPKLGAVFDVAESTQIYARLASGFRAPQATELYRLQNQQDVADLDSERLDSFELGIRGRSEAFAWDVTGFAMRKDNFIFRDADGFNVSDGKTDHQGIEWSLRWNPAEKIYLAGDGTWAEHTYAFSRDAALGETIVDGNDMDTAPRWFASTRFGWVPSPDAAIELEWIHMGEYYLDAANEHEYEGHDLVQLYGEYRMNPHWTLFGAITNLGDTDYAERADFAFGNYRYFPGAPRQFFVGVRFGQ